MMFFNAPIGDKTINNTPTMMESYHLKPKNKKNSIKLVAVKMERRKKDMQTKKLNFNFLRAYPISPPRKAKLLWFVDDKPHDARELQYNKKKKSLDVLIYMGIAGPLAV